MRKQAEQVHKSLRDIAKGRSRTKETVSGHKTLEAERKAKGQPPWFSFDKNLSEKQLVWMERAFPHAYTRLRSLITSLQTEQKTPLFVSLASAASSGIPGTKTISVTLSPGEQSSDASHTILNSDLTTSAARNKLLEEIEKSGASLAFIDFSASVPATEYETDSYAKAKFSTLMRNLAERLAQGGMILMILRNTPERDKELEQLFSGTSMQRVRENESSLEILYEKS